MQEMKEGFVQPCYEGPVKRWVQTMDLRDQPELIAEYRKRHARGEVWQEILQGIRDCGLLEMEIYILGTRLVMICEGPADLDWEEAMRKMASGPRQREWEDYMAVFQNCLPGQQSDEKWQMMDRMFHLY